jgi:hypothetical protein
MGLEWGDWDFLPGQELPKRGDFKREKHNENGHAFRCNGKG